MKILNQRNSPSQTQLSMNINSEDFFCNKNRNETIRKSLFIECIDLY